MTPGAQAVLRASRDLMESMFPIEANYFLQTEALCAPNVRFFEAETDGTPVSCAALANHGTYGEVKSMYVLPAARGMGVATKLLASIFDEARVQNLPRLKLETGMGLEAAQRLYHRNGFNNCRAFGNYPSEAPLSRYMECVL